MNRFAPITRWLESSNRSSRITIVIVLLAVTAITFWPMMVHYFAIDDFSWLYYAGKGIDTPREWIEAFTRINGSGQYRPLSQQLFFWTGYQLFGLESFGYHVINSVTYIASCGLFYGFVRHFTPKRIISALATLVFCLTPVHVEHLFWVSAYTETLATLCVAGALYCSVKGSRLWVVGWYILGLCANETSIIIPLFIFAYHWIYERKSFKQSLLNVRSLLIVLAVYTILRLTVFGGLGAKGVFQAVWSPAVWLKEIIHSAQVAMGFGPVMDGITGSSDIWRHVVTAMSLLLVAGVAYGIMKAVHSSVRMRLIVLGILFFIVGLLPVLPFAYNFADYTISIAAMGLPLILIGLLGQESRSAYAYPTVVVSVVILFLICIYAPKGLYRIDGYRMLSRADESAFTLLKQAYGINAKPQNILVTGEKSEVVMPGIDEMARLIDPRSRVVADDSGHATMILRYEPVSGLFSIDKHPL